MTSIFDYSMNVVVGKGAVGNMIAQSLGKRCSIHCGGRTLINSFSQVHCLYQDQVDNLIYAALPGRKYLANADPVADFDGITDRIDKLEEFVKMVSVKRLFFISTTDVQFNHAYGINRLEAEQLVKQRIAPHVQEFFIVRLPMLIGKGVQKNMLFDLVNDRVLPDEMSPSDVEDLRNIIEKISGVSYLNEAIGQLEIVEDRSRPTIDGRVSVEFLPSKMAWKIIGAGTHLMKCTSHQANNIFALSDIIDALDQVYHSTITSGKVVSLVSSNSQSKFIGLSLSSLATLQLAGYGTSALHSLRLHNGLGEYEAEMNLSDGVIEDMTIVVPLKKNIIEHVNDMIITE